MAETCTNCGTALLDGAAFCAECGAASAAASAPLPGPRTWPTELPPHPPTPFVHPPDEPGHLVFPTAPLLPAEPEPPVFDRNGAAGVLGLAGALVLGVSTFVAWAEITLALLTERTRSVSGWDWFDGQIQTGPLLCVLALVAAGLAGLLLAHVSSLLVRIGIAGTGALSLGLAIFAISDIAERQAEVQAVGNVSIDFAAGMWLVVAGAAAILFAGAIADHRPPASGVPVGADLG